MQKLIELVLKKTSWVNPKSIINRLKYYDDTQNQQSLLKSIFKSHFPFSATFQNEPKLREDDHGAAPQSKWAGHQPQDGVWTIWDGTQVETDVRVLWICWCQVWFYQIVVFIEDSVRKRERVKYYRRVPATSLVINNK